MSDAFPVDPDRGNEGRPTKYRPEHVQTVREMAKLGATNVEIAHKLGVDPVTLWDWKRKHRAFANAFKAGKAHADERVVMSLYEKAVVAGDTTACIFWLKNRRPEEWRDKVEVQSSRAIEVVHRIVDERQEGEEIVDGGQLEQLEEEAAK